MNSDRDMRAGIALMLMAAWYAQVFEKITGMTLAEWDERNYQRIMAAGD